MGALLASLPTVTVALCDDGTLSCRGHEPFLRREADGGAAAPAGPPERH